MTLKTKTIRRKIKMIGNKIKKIIKIKMIYLCMEIQTN